MLFILSFTIKTSFFTIFYNFFLQVFAVKASLFTGFEPALPDL